jgi:hypothetical protein
LLEEVLLKSSRSFIKHNFIKHCVPILARKTLDFTVVPDRSLFALQMRKCSLVSRFSKERNSCAKQGSGFEPALNGVREET